MEVIHVNYIHRFLLFSRSYIKKPVLNRALGPTIYLDTPPRDESSIIWITKLREVNLQDTLENFTFH